MKLRFGHIVFSLHENENFKKLYGKKHYSRLTIKYYIHLGENNGISSYYSGFGCFGLVLFST